MSREIYKESKQSGIRPSFTHQKFLTRNSPFPLLKIHIIQYVVHSHYDFTIYIPLHNYINNGCIVITVRHMNSE